MHESFAIDLVDQFLYWTSTNLVGGARVHRAALDGSNPTTLISLGPVANPRGIAVDPAGGKLYWADFEQDAIFRSNLDGSSAGVWIALPGNSRPYGVAFDPVGQRIYWTEYTGKMRRAPTATGVMSTLIGGLANGGIIALRDPSVGRATRAWGTRAARVRVPQAGVAPCTPAGRARAHSRRGPGPGARAFVWPT